MFEGVFFLLLFLFCEIVNESGLFKLINNYISS